MADSPVPTRRERSANGTNIGQFFLLKGTVREGQQYKRVHDFGQLGSLQYRQHFNSHAQRISYLGDCLCPSINLPSLLSRFLPCLEAPSTAVRTVSYPMVTSLTGIATCGGLGGAFQSARTKLRLVQQICDGLQYLSA